MDQKALVKRRRSYKVRITVYINTWIVCQTRVHRSLILKTLAVTLSLSLTGKRLCPQQARRVSNRYFITRRTMDDYRNSPTIKFCADLFPAHRCPSAIKFKKKKKNTTGSPSALCVGSGFRGHLVEFGRSILELLGYYLMPNKCKNLKDIKSSCLSVCTNSL